MLLKEANRWKTKPTRAIRTIAAAVLVSSQSTHLLPVRTRPVPRAQLHLASHGCQHKRVVDLRLIMAWRNFFGSLPQSVYHLDPDPPYLGQSHERDTKSRSGCAGVGFSFLSLLPQHAQQLVARVKRQNHQLQLQHRVALVSWIRWHGILSTTVPSNSESCTVSRYSEKAFGIQALNHVEP